MNDADFNLIEAASFSPASVEAPDAWVGHLPFAAWLIKYFKPNIFVELGTHSGNSYFSFCQAVQEAGFQTKCYAVDTWQGEEHAGFYDEKVFHKVNAHNHQKYENFSRLLRMVFDEAAEYFSDGSIDLLHIDGLHTYEAVRHDFETWLPKLAPGAIVLFHDINVRERGFGVWKLWEELKKRYPNYLEFTHCNGLGVLQIGDDGKKEAHEWLQSSSPFQQTLKDYFSALGARQSERFELAVLKHNVQALNSNLSEKEGRIAGLNQVVAERDGQIASLNRAVSERDSQIIGLSSEIAAIHATISWRLTKPLRFVSHQIARGKRLVRASYSAVQMGGGLRGTLRKVFGIYRRVGIRGLISKFHYVMRAGDPYTNWIQRCDTLDVSVLAEMRQKTGMMDYRPIFSVILPVYNTPEKYLRLAIESVLNQVYPYWELCIADDASPEPHVRKVLEEYAGSDERIKVAFLDQNGHISAASNHALELATGEFVALLDHDDELRPHALYMVAKALCKNPALDMIYSDEDKINSEGARFGAYFKPDWSPDTFMCQMYTCHLGVYRRALVESIGGFRLGFEGGQDYDLVLRLTEQTTSDKIYHIPHILYHWRAIEGSTAFASSAKNYAYTAALQALQEALDRRGEGGVAEDVNDYPGHFRVRYPVPSTSKVSIVIPTRDKAELLETCLESIFGMSSFGHFEVVVVDNGSQEDATFILFDRWKAREPERFIVERYDIPFNYPKLNNRGVEVSTGDLLLFLNNDTEVITADWLERMAGFAARTSIGAVGAKLLYQDNTIQHAGVLLGIGGTPGGHSHLGFESGSSGNVGRLLLQANYAAVTGACLMVKRADFEAVNGFTEDLAVAFNDVDFCLKLLEIGRYNVVLPDVVLYHYESKSRGYEDTPEKVARFNREAAWMKERWGGLLENDPFYNPNLTLDATDYGLGRYAPLTEQ